MKPKTNDLILRLLHLKRMAVKKNLWKTFHKINDAINQAGWEIAEQKGR